MKKYQFLLFICLIVGLGNFSCTPEKTFPSPLSNVTISDQVFLADETQRSLDTRTRLEDTEATTIDLATGTTAEWLRVTVSNTTIEFKLLENITIQDRQAKVKLAYVGTRTDLEGTSSIEFLLTQKKNKMFEDLNIEEIKRSSLRGDTVITTSSKLTNVKAFITDKDGLEPSWCTVKTNENSLSIHVEENKNNSVRQAYVRLRPYTNQVAVADSLIAKKMFVVTQAKNPVLDSLKIGTVTMAFEDSKKILKTDRQLTGIKAIVTDTTTNEKCTWGSVPSIAGDSITLHVNKLSSNTDRVALVTLYLPNNGDIIDSTTIVYSFILKQKHNDVLEGKTIPAQQLTFDQSTDTIKVSYSLKGFKAQLLDNVSGKTPTWLQAEVEEHNIILKATAKNMAKSDRLATVTIYQPNNGNIIDDNTIYTSFKVTHQHNTATDSLAISSRSVEADQTIDSVTVDCSLKGFSSKNIDRATSTSARWLNVQVQDQKIFLKSAVNNTSEDRSALVTIYQPNNDPVYKDTIQHTFLFTQKAKKRLEPETNKLETDYTAHSVSFKVTSNVKYQIMEDCDWILSYKMTPIDEEHEKLTFDLSENETTEDRIGTIVLSSGSLKAIVTLTQKTNPDINFLDLTSDNLLFGKYSSSFSLKIKTLTPNYTITKAQNSSWLSIRGKSSQGNNLYLHNIYLQDFFGDVGDRIDTIIVKNFIEEKRLIIKQTNYLALNITTVEIEEGKQLQLSCENLTQVPITWSTTNKNVALVDNSGMISALKSGTATIKASIGAYGNIADYYDQCVVKVYNASDKVSISLDKSTGSFMKTGGYVTSNCPIIIQNDFNSMVSINSVKIEGNDGDYAFTCSDKNVNINMGKSHTFKVEQMKSVLNPVIIVTMTCNGKSYTKKINYQ